MRQDDSIKLTQTGRATQGGALLRRFWHPVALLDEFEPAAHGVQRPVKPVRLLGQEFVLFKDASGGFGLLDRNCPHRGADLAFGRLESIETSRWGEPSNGLRCPFHGWKFAVDGRCLDTPAEPQGSRLCERVSARSYPLEIRNGVVFAWLGDADAAPPLPDLDFFRAPESHTFAFKGLWRCNWLQAQEVGLDPAHTSFLHAFFEDEEDLTSAYGRQFRNASAGTIDGEKWPMTRIMREFHRPEIRSEPTPWGQRITTLRRISDELMHVRVTHGLFPNGFVIPLSETMTITQFHVPIDDENTWWYSFFTSFSEPVNKQAMRDQRLLGNPAPSYEPVMGAHNQWGYDPVEQMQHTMLGMGEQDINVHDQWACESMGATVDRTQEHLGTTDRAIIINRRQLLEEMTRLAAGGATSGMSTPEGARAMTGPDTIDGIAPAASWERWWQEAVERKRAAAPWSRATEIKVA
jgi:phenylpropionate dioxygenase-like ring-hydroxylating dioxygenase large terminal subunit